MTDIVERLRARAQSIIDFEAADEIERLRIMLRHRDEFLAIKPDIWKEFNAYLLEIDADEIQAAAPPRQRPIDHCQCEYPLIKCDQRGCHCTICGVPERRDPPVKEALQVAITALRPFALRPGAISLSAALGHISREHLLAAVEAIDSCEAAISATANR
jgi:hypothetical protein